MRRQRGVAHVGSNDATTQRSQRAKQVETSRLQSDYMLATPSALGRIVFGRPVVLLVEARRNDFVEGWRQGAAAMVAAQKLNGDPTFAVYGMVTDGEVWRVGKLMADTCVDHPTLYTINNNISELVGGLAGILATVQRQIMEIWRPARV